MTITDTWLIVSMWRGRNRCRNRFSRKVSANHHVTAPPRNPAMVSNPPKRLPTSVTPSVETLNIVKKIMM